MDLGMGMHMGLDAATAMELAKKTGRDVDEDATNRRRCT
jgi:hypothetical protein